MIRRVSTVRLLIAGMFTLVLAGCGVVQDLLPDLTGPTVTIVSGVTDGATVSTSSLTFTVRATDDRAVTSVSSAVGASAATSCAAAGTDTFSCTTSTLAFGANTIVVTAFDAAGNSGSRTIGVTYEPPVGSSDFDIQIIYFDEAFSADHKAAFDTAVALWRSVIIGDIADVVFTKPANGSCGQGEPAIDQTVDDVVIFATSFTDAPGGVLGTAGPCFSRTGSSDFGTTIAGYMEFDTEDLDALSATNDLAETIAHEMGHVIGIGTNWEAPGLGFDFLDYTPSDSSPDCANAAGFTVPPSYTGAEGVDAWQADLGGSGQVPVEDEFGLGTQCGHWNDYDFGNELMTGILDGGAFNPLSILSVRSLEDIGYTVDTGAAEPYSLPASPGLGTQSAEGIDLAAAEILLRPIGGIDPETGVETEFGGR